MLPTCACKQMLMMKWNEGRLRSSHSNHVHGHVPCQECTSAKTNKRAGTLQFRPNVSPHSFRQPTSLTTNDKPATEDSIERYAHSLLNISTQNTRLASQRTTANTLLHPTSSLSWAASTLKWSDATLSSTLFPASLLDNGRLETLRGGSLCGQSGSLPAWSYGGINANVDIGTSLLNNRNHGVSCLLPSLLVSMTDHLQYLSRLPSQAFRLRRKARILPQEEVCINRSHLLSCLTWL
jgi:hypothetical protein